LSNLPTGVEFQGSIIFFFEGKKKEERNKNEISSRYRWLSR